MATITSLKPRIPRSTTKPTIIQLRNFSITHSTSTSRFAKKGGREKTKSKKDKNVEDEPVAAGRWLPVEEELLATCYVAVSEDNNVGSASTQFRDLMEQELRLKRKAAERAFEAQAEKARTLMRLEELRFLATSTKDFDDDDAYWIKKQKRLIKNKMRNDLGDEDDEDE
nr:hypothetical protein [Tanacetum cinerariifolium]